MTQQEQYTPLMQQYHTIKAQYQDALLFFQVGDFYELFYHDAQQAATFLGIALTARGKSKTGEPIPLCGVPVHAKDHYIGKLIKGGFKVAICEQLELPKPGTVVRRGITQVITPGTITDSQLLDAKSASYLFSFFPAQDSWGLLFGELLTAQLFATVIPPASDKLLDAELSRFFPDEIVIPKNKEADQLASFFRKRGYVTSPLAIDPYDPSEKETMDHWMEQQFTPDVVTTVSQQDALRCALFYFYAYVRRNQQEALSQFKNLNMYQADDFLLIDAATQKNLELIKNAQDGSAKGTLFAVVDRAVTSMGSRMIKKWLVRPLVKQRAIEQRLDVIGAFSSDVALLQQLQQLLSSVGDIERIVGRIGLKRAPVHDYLFLNAALRNLNSIRNVLNQKSELTLVAVILQNVGDFKVLEQLLERALHQETNEQLIKKGFDLALDTIRELAEHSDQAILALEVREQEKTGINSLKIRYNQISGYYIEVTHANKDLVPDYYVRQQTLAGRERYIMPELQRLAGEILRARNELEMVERAVFERVKEEVYLYITPLRKLAHALAHLDALVGFARVAYDNGYVRPQLHSSRDIIINAGRHPVVESQGNSFIPNDTHLTDEQSLWIITGPNMGGKSTYLRQVALICLLAQTGSFVPVQAAQLPILDRIFTRIGAGDNLAEGKSTFLIEMEETAAICTQATSRSLVILDEVGRGTSTYDGLAIAQAVVEYLHSKVGARCLFATHYHELTHLQEKMTGVVSFYAASTKTPQGILFLYKMVRGVADGSFGVEVAKLAQLPPVIVDRAQQLLGDLQAGQLPMGVDQVLPARLITADTVQLENQIRLLKEKNLSQGQVLDAIKALDMDDLTPKRAFDLLWKLKSELLLSR